MAAPAERLPFEDGRFDTVVVTLVLCTVQDPAKALEEIARVLKPGGQLLFTKHVRAPDGVPWPPGRTASSARGAGSAGGCHPNRDTVAALEASPLSVESAETGELPRRRRSCDRGSPAYRPRRLNA